jgi:hypothetical protein
MIAEIKGKISENTSLVIERSEDELTGNFFGCMRYLPFERGLKQILLSCVRSCNIAAILEKSQPQCWPEDVSFWDKHRIDKSADSSRFIEPDVMIHLSDVVILIEVKLYSGRSSDKQLIKEAEMLKNSANGKTPLLLFLACEPDGQIIYNEDNAEIKSIGGVQFGYMSWQSILSKLNSVRDDITNNCERQIIVDLIELLSRKNLERFSGFGTTEISVDISQHWTFSLPDVAFSFVSDVSIEREDYYEFK